MRRVVVLAKVAEDLEADPIRLSAQMSWQVSTNLAPLTSALKPA